MIEKLLSRNEGKTLEFKENTQSLSNIIKTAIAFANTAGGIIVIGIQDTTKKITGVTNALDEEERLVNTISDSIAPFLLPNIEIQTYRNKELIIIHIPHLAGPYYLKSAGSENGVYVRFGSTNRIADSQMLDSLRLFARKLSFDEVPYYKAQEEILDWQALESSFKKVNKEITHEKAIDLELLIENAGILHPSFGAILLFGTNRKKVFPDAVIRCAKFIGDSKSKILDHTDIDTYPIFALEDAIHFIEKNTLMGAQIGKTRRMDLPQYPPIAIREAIMNAIIHTDYSLKGTSIMIAIFDDRIEITNPGGLPFGMTLEHAISGSSRVRNRVIARVFRELRFIEQWGSGLQRIIESCIELGLEKPKFEELNNKFRVTLFAARTKRVKLDENQQAFIDFLKIKGKVGTKEAAEFWGISPRNARLRLSHLIDLGFITKISTSLKDPHSKYVIAHEFEEE